MTIFEVFLLLFLFLVLYYSLQFLLRLLDKKFQVRIGSIGLFSLSDLKHFGIRLVGTHEYTYRITVQKFHFHLSKPHLGKRAWVTLIIKDAKLNISSLKLFQSPPRKRSHARQPSLISVVPQKAWWSSVWVLKFAVAKISAIPFQFFLSAITNYISLHITNLEILIDDLGQFSIEDVSLDSNLFAQVENTTNKNCAQYHQPSRDHLTQEHHSIKNTRHVFSNKVLNLSLNYSSLSIIDIESLSSNQKSDQQKFLKLSPAIVFPYPSTINLSCDLSPACTSIIALEFNLLFQKIIVGLDGILRISNAIKVAFPKNHAEAVIKPLSRRPAISHSRSFTMASLLDTPIGRKILPQRRKRTPIEFLSYISLSIGQVHLQYERLCLEEETNIPIGVDLNVTDFSTSLRRKDFGNDKLISDCFRKSISFIEESKVGSFDFDFEIASVYSDLADTKGKTRLMEIDKIIHHLQITTPLDNIKDDEDPNSFSVIGDLEISIPEVIIDYTHIDSFHRIIKTLKASEEISVKLKPPSKIPSASPSLISTYFQEQLQNIPKAVLNVAILRPNFKITGIPFQENKSMGCSDSQIAFGFQDILLNLNGDYRELDNLTSTQHERTLSRRYVKGWTPPAFSLIYNLVASLKSRNLRLYTLENDLLVNHSCELNIISSALGTFLEMNPVIEKETFQISLSCLIDGFQVRLCNKNNFFLLEKIIQKVKEESEFEDGGNNIVRSETYVDPSSNLFTPGIETPWIPETLQFHFSLNSVEIKVAEIDCLIDPSVSRGFEARLEAIVLDYRGVRACVDPIVSYQERVGLGLSANDDPFESGDNVGGKIRGVLRGFKLIPILALWDLDLLRKTRPLISIKKIEGKCKLDVDHSKNELFLEATLSFEELTIIYSLFYHYCILVAIMNLIQLAPNFCIKPDSSFSHSNELLFPEKTSRATIKLKITSVINVFNIFVNLSENLELYARIDGLKHTFLMPRPENSCSIKRIRVFGTNPADCGLWDQLINIMDSHLLISDDFGDKNVKKNTEMVIGFQSEAAHIRVPHNYIFADVFDGLADLVKSLKNIQKRLIFKVETTSLEPEEEGPIHLPTLRLDIGILTFRLEDDPFEGQLGLIWQVGGIEQRARLDREAAFKAKVESIEADQAQKSTSDSMNSGVHLSHVVNEGAIGSSPKLKFTSTGSLPSPRAKVSIDAARIALDEYNSGNWIKRIRAAKVFRCKLNQTKHFSKDEEDNLPIKTTQTSLSPPALLKVTLDRVLINLSCPSFPMENLPEFMNRIGKGLPLDTKFTLLVPMHVNCKLNEAWVQIRDYPTPLAHIPPIEQFEAKKRYSSIFNGDLVIAEELRGLETVRKSVMTVVPPQYNASNQAYNIIVPRTCSPVKLYSDLYIDINSTYTTVFSWSISMQPAVLDIARVVESFTKPNPDLSEPIGFWDKFRLIMHIRILMEFKGGGDVRFLSQGTRNPYLVTGPGSGFALCFKNGVKIRLGYSNNAGEFLQVDSEEFKLAIPNLVEMVANGNLSAENTIVKEKKSPQDTIVRDIETSTMRTQSSSNTLVGTASNDGLVKVLMKIGGGVRYGMGCQFHRSCSNENALCPRCHGEGSCRFSDFIPHYEVITRMPEHPSASGGQIYDSFRGFRSDIVHLSFSMVCPIDWDSSINNNNDNEQPHVGSYNSIQVTPKSIEHAFAWISLFDNAMFIPIRQGMLFPTNEPPSPKLSKFLHTLKYKICLAPLFLSHFYKENAFEDWNDGRTQIVGLKGKIEQFKIDIHQKVQEKLIQVEQDELKVREMILHEAEMDLKNLDVRGIAVRYIEEPTYHSCNEINEPTEHNIRIDQLGKDEDFVLNPEDEEWIDEDDYVEIDSILPNVKPKMRVLPFMQCPQLMYYKHVLEDDTDEDKRMDQEAHMCIMGQVRGTRDTQIDLLNKRLNQIEREFSRQTDNLKDTDEKLGYSESQDIKDESRVIQQAIKVLSGKRRFIQSYIAKLEKNSNDQTDVREAKHIHRDTANGNFDHNDDKASFSGEDDMSGYNPNSPFWADLLYHFDHRFLIHSAQVIWNNSLRNLIYKYWDLIEQQQGLTYYMSMNAVKFIRELQKSTEKIQKTPSNESQASMAPNFDPAGFDAHMAAELLRQLVGEKNTSFVVPNEVPVAEDNISTNNDHSQNTESHQSGDIPEGYTLCKKYVVQLINTQINFQSDKNPVASIIMSTERAQLKCFSIIEDRLRGDANEVVKTRTIFGLDNTQLFLTWKRDFQNDDSKLLSANNFGAKANEKWPVWVPIESLFNYDEKSSFPFQRIVERTSATLLYDKFNHLRIKGCADDRESTETIWDESEADKFDRRMDSWHINFPSFKFSATSAQYCVFVDMVSDLFMYREPTKTERMERLETILLAADLDDLTGTSEMVASLQQRIRQMDEFRRQLQTNFVDLREEGLRELWTVKAELLNSQEELYILMEAITATQNKKQKAESNTPLKTVVTANEVIWIMLLDNKNSFCEWGLSNAHFVWMTREDNSSVNILEIDHLRVLNKMPSPVFTELIYPYITDYRRQVVDFSRNKMLRLYWREMEPVAGIAVVEHFEVKFFPLKLQIQYEIGKHIVTYIFPQKRKSKTFDIFHDSIIDDQKDINSEEHATIMDESIINQKNPLSSRRDSVGTDNAGSKVFKTTSINDMSGDDSSFGESTCYSESDILPVTEEGLLMATSNSSTANDVPLSTKKSRNGVGDSINSKESDELTLMKTRASNNKTFIYINIPEVTHNISYQGAKEKNLEDLYDFVFTLPTIIYQNKTWSWLDLLEHLKRDIIKTIIYHTGALVREKFLQTRRGRPPHPNLTSSSALQDQLSTIYSGSNTLLESTDQIVETASFSSNFSDANVVRENKFELPILGDDLLEEQLSDKGSVMSSDSQEKPRIKRGLLAIKLKKQLEKPELILTESAQSSPNKLATSSGVTVENDEEKKKLLLGKLSS
ncbi:hypothetical protein G9A89_001318 [Geosiphon pyriformis]|nr:hypothetical protein G9A89_001318 [Geosiphon pyriformis]